jgi:hypothetical protein
LSGRSHQVGRSVFTFRRLSLLAILSEPNFCSPLPFPTLPPFACPALALFWSAASGNLIIRERDLGSRYFFRVYYLSTRGKLYSGFPFTVPSPAPLCVPFHDIRYLTSEHLRLHFLFCSPRAHLAMVAGLNPIGRRAFYLFSPLPTLREPKSPCNQKPIYNQQRPSWLHVSCGGPQAPFR